MENGQFAYGVLFQWKYKTYNILVLKKKLVIITQNEKNISSYWHENNIAN
jgi:hypothetical protein